MASTPETNKRPGHVTSVKVCQQTRIKNLDNTFQWVDIPMFATFADYCLRKSFDSGYEIEDKKLQAMCDVELIRFMKSYHAAGNNEPRNDLIEHWEKVSTNIHVSTFGTVNSNLDRMVKNRTAETNSNAHLRKENFEYEVHWTEHSRPQCWEFDKLKGTKTVMLLDEPDANMHPTIVCEYIKRYKEEFVKKYNVQVIMTTHNPTTLCAVDKKDIFLVTKTPNGCAKVEHVTSKQSAIRQLTPTMISIYEGVRFVFLEGKEADIAWLTTIVLIT